MAEFSVKDKEEVVSRKVLIYFNNEKLSIFIIVKFSHEGYLYEYKLNVS